MDQIEMQLTAGQIQALFLEWLTGRRTPLTLGQFQRVVAESETPLPPEVCEADDWPPGTTVGHAARSSVSFLIDGREHRLANRLSFETEAESLRWWRANRDNPDRVSAHRTGDGRWQLVIAGIEQDCPSGWRDGF